MPGRVRARVPGGGVEREEEGQEEGNERTGSCEDGWIEDGGGLRE
jgi:hypothetical protein